MNKAISTPHDAVFKTYLSHSDTARDFLQLYLPEALKEICDLRTLHLESGNFVEEDLRPYYSDILYSLQTTAGDGYIYALIEHQSSPDRHMAFRLMRYAVAVMQRHLDAGHEKLPLVIPVLFYHGLVTPYPFSMRWLDEFAAPELATTLYHGEFPLADITVIPDDEIATHQRMATLELLQKHIRQRDLAQLLDKLGELLLTGLATQTQVQALMHYLVLAGNSREPIKFIRELARRTPQHKETLMTIAEYLEQQGLERGLLQGRQEGLVEGRKEEALRIAAAMLRSGLAPALVAQLTGLAEQELASLSA
ncbi:TPA: Rpn family recombination-promoting nuclease/putative transposase [Klebsiella aerogenes]|uniref:Rpn family recombination-promoting nuclease/putative transposase n=1 Tax=Klebsiella aerogenes TaxID=548 RepID=UPI0027820FFD|nr:Rpn family recombination-promoting nuclease/putative transposase [Klebsiella aerogenes]MDT8883618.1 Rpn family recombination-promoting nuclease/putative transposase [Klebsiella aerogenes]HDT1380849.1 Rpn family recombination-promoting nuclease/putative transposase [Klebsiella aerogenes]HDU5287263.1 Rpn family recombination-promoting nuclease/putative transposase [Klebsiella aerogenes]